MANRLYCPDCRELGDSRAEYCTSCGTKLVPCMRIVIMPFVESGQEPGSLAEFKEIVEREGELQPSQAIGCQMQISSEMEKQRLIISQKEAYFDAAENILPQIVKDNLDPLGFYEIPDPLEVDQITEEAANMPTELFVLIQNRYDPEYLFLPEINYFFFRYPHMHTSGTGDDSGFGFVQISAFLLDNRENRIVSKGSGAGLELFDPQGASLDESFTIPVEKQLEIMRKAGVKSVLELLTTMKMTK